MTPRTIPEYRRIEQERRKKELDDQTAVYFAQLNERFFGGTKKQEHEHEHTSK